MRDCDRACPACKQCRARKLYTHEGVRFVRCGSCGTIYHASPPDRKRTDRIYHEAYHEQRGHGSDPAVELAKQATTLAYLKMVERLEPPGRHLVEVGCSAGAGLAAAAGTGWEAVGVELSARSAEIARRRPGVQAVHTGHLHDAPLVDGQVDVITLFDVIEHIDPPDETLATVHRLLRPGGLVLMVTPDAASLSARFMRARWPHLLAEHVVLFSRQGMRIALRAAGLHVERIGFAWKQINLDMLVRHVTIHQHVSFSRSLRLLGSVLPVFALRWIIPFNVGEFYVVARRPASPQTR